MPKEVNQERKQVINWFKSQELYNAGSRVNQETNKHLKAFMLNGKEIFFAMKPTAELLALKTQCETILATKPEGLTNARWLTMLPEERELVINTQVDVQDARTRTRNKQDAWFNQYASSTEGLIITFDDGEQQKVNKDKWAQMRTGETDAKDGSREGYINACKAILKTKPEGVDDKEWLAMSPAVRKNQIAARESDFASLDQPAVREAMPSFDDRGTATAPRAPAPLPRSSKKRDELQTKKGLVEASIKTRESGKKFKLKSLGKRVQAKIAKIEALAGDHKNNPKFWVKVNTLLGGKNNKLSVKKMVARVVNELEHDTNELISSSLSNNLKAHKPDDGEYEQGFQIASREMSRSTSGSSLGANNDSEIDEDGYLVARRQSSDPDNKAKRKLQATPGDKQKPQPGDVIYGDAQNPDGTPSADMGDDSPVLPPEHQYAEVDKSKAPPKLPPRVNRGPEVAGGAPSDNAIDEPVTMENRSLSLKSFTGSYNEMEDERGALGMENRSAISIGGAALNASNGAYSAPDDALLDQDGNPINRGAGAITHEPGYASFEAPRSGVPAQESDYDTVEQLDSNGPLPPLPPAGAGYGGVVLLANDQYDTVETRQVAMGDGKIATYEVVSPGVVSSPKLYEVPELLRGDGEDIKRGTFTSDDMGKVIEGGQITKEQPEGEVPLNRNPDYDALPSNDHAGPENNGALVDTPRSEHGAFSAEGFANQALKASEAAKEAKGGAAPTEEQDDSASYSNG